MGIVAPTAHHSGRIKSASSPSAVNVIQKIFRSTDWIVGQEWRCAHWRFWCPQCPLVAWAMYS